MMLVDSEKSSSEEKELDKMLESESELAPKYTGGGGGRGGRGVPLSRTNGEKEQTIEQMIKKVGWGLLRICDIYGGALLTIYDIYGYMIYIAVGC